MQVKVRLFGSMRDLLPPEKRGKTTLKLSQGAIVQDVLDHLGIDDYVIVSVNNEQESDSQTSLNAGDSILIFEAAAGG